jgi:putative oxidoreductase
MKNIRSRIEPYTFAVFRIVFGLLFLQFGTQKLFEWPSAPVGYTPETILIVAAWIELICGFLIMIGLVADIAAFVASGEMAIAYFLGHFPIAFWPIASRGVPAVLFCFAFLYIAVHGAGILSVDSLWRKTRSAVL